MSQALIAIFYTLLCAPGLLTWWLLHVRVEPHLIAAIPAPLVRYTAPIEINPLHNDWRGFT